MRLSIPERVVGQPSNARRCMIFWMIRQFSHPDITGSKSLVTFPLVLANDQHIRIGLRIAARILTIVGNKKQSRSIWREGQPPIVLIRIDTSIRFLQARKRNGNSLLSFLVNRWTQREQPDINRRFRVNRGTWCLFPATRAGSRGKKRNPFTIRRKHGTSRIWLIRFEGDRLQRIAPGKPESVPRHLAPGINPVANRNGRLTSGRDHNRTKTFRFVKITGSPGTWFLSMNTKR